VIWGETVLSGAKHPNTELKVLKSPAGYYVGFLDKDGCAYSRESHYVSEQVAHAILVALRYSEYADGETITHEITSDKEEIEALRGIIRNKDEQLTRIKNEIAKYQDEWQEFNEQVITAITRLAERGLHDER
jgi:uncharacterized protein (DUF1015 family)